MSAMVNPSKANSVSVPQDLSQAIKKYLVDLVTSLNEEVTSEMLDSDGIVPEKVSKIYTCLITRLNRKYSKIYKMNNSFSKANLYNTYQKMLENDEILLNPLFEHVCKTRGVRSISGILPISLSVGNLNLDYLHYAIIQGSFCSQTKSTQTLSGQIQTTNSVCDIEILNNWDCSKDCYMCPNQKKKFGSHIDIARSYLDTEGTFKQGIVENFDPFFQFLRRNIELETMGHICDKEEIIILGGTANCFPRDYLENYVRGIFQASNVYKHFSVSQKGKYASQVKEWLKLKPFIGRTLVDTQTQKANASHKKVSVKEIKVDWTQVIKETTLDQEKKHHEQNTLATISGVVFETRPDMINKHTCALFRHLGCTRLQLGVQSLNNNVLELINRGHTAEQAHKGILIALDNCFKVDIHLMFDLLGSTPESDKDTMDTFFKSDTHTDYVKLYPCLNVSYTEIRKMHNRYLEYLEEKNTEEIDLIHNLMINGDLPKLREIAKERGKSLKDILIWIPYQNTHKDDYRNLMAYTMQSIPPWTRNARTQRDFPSESVDKETNEHLAGFQSDTIKSNECQLVRDIIHKEGGKCYDIRSREIRGRISQNFADRLRPYIRCYSSYGGIEFYISVEIPVTDPKCVDDTSLLGHCRLRLPEWELGITLVNKGYGVGIYDKAPNYYMNIFKDPTCLLARIREVHTYGNIQGINMQKSKNISSEGNRAKKSNSQHLGVGKFNVKISEMIAYHMGFHGCVVISSVGTRNYYRKLGYELIENKKGEFMVKMFTPKNIKIMFDQGASLFKVKIESFYINSVVDSFTIVRKLNNNYDKISLDSKIIPKFCEIHTYEEIKNNDAEVCIIDLPKFVEIDKNIYYLFYSIFIIYMCILFFS